MHTLLVLKLYTGVHPDTCSMRDGEILSLGDSAVEG
jgi:hypothetical protein